MRSSTELRAVAQFPEPVDGSVRFGPFELLVNSRELRNGATKIRLQEQPFELLQMMLEHPGQVVTRDRLRERLWPEGTFVDFDHSLNAAVKRLRAALGDSADNPRFVETLPRRGYRFIGALQPNHGQAANGRHWRRSRLAVMPFSSLGNASVRDDFTDGLTEEMMARLGHVSPHRIVLIAGRSSMLFRGAGQRAHEIGRALRADYLLEGSVRCAGERVRITARLIETSDETHLWSETYERQLDDSFLVQSDVAACVAQSLAQQLELDHPENAAAPPATTSESK